MQTKQTMIVEQTSLIPIYQMWFTSVGDVLLMEQEYHNSMQLFRPT